MKKVRADSAPRPIRVNNVAIVCANVRERLKNLDLGIAWPRLYICDFMVIKIKISLVSRWSPGISPDPVQVDSIAQQKFLISDLIF